MEIKEGNKLIAEFMGIDLSKKVDVVGEEEFFINNTWRSLKQFEYHSSWDWIMPVVEKIERTKCADYSFNYNITGDGVCISKFDDGSGVIHCVSNKWGESKLNASWKCVVEFITWYKQLNN